MKVREATEVEISAVSLLVMAMVTSAAGLLVRDTVKAPVPPASVVTMPEVGDTWMPAWSLSATWTGLVAVTAS